MSVKQTIAVIGASGKMGGAISRALAKGNYRLLLCSDDQEEVQALIHEINNSCLTAEVESLECSVNASWEADIIIAAVPYDAEKKVAQKIKEVANQKIVISISNPVNGSFDALVTAPETSAAEELQMLLPNSKVVKAFNNTFAADFSELQINGNQVDAFIAGNDADAVKTVEELVKMAGFNPIVAGNLSVSRTLEQMQLLLIQLGIRYQYKGPAGWKVLHN